MTRNPQTGRWTLPRDGWLVRWAYWFDNAIPHKTNLCTLFWRTTFLAPAVAVSAAVFIFLCLRGVWFALDAANTYAFACAGTVGVALLWALPTLVVGMLHADVRSRIRIRVQSAERRERSMVWEAVKAKKRGLCPLIELQD